MSKIVDYTFPEEAVDAITYINNRAKLDCNTDREEYDAWVDLCENLFSDIMFDNDSDLLLYMEKDGVGIGWCRLDWIMAVQSLINKGRPSPHTQLNFTVDPEEVVVVNNKSYVRFSRMTLKIYNCFLHPTILYNYLQEY